jgi:thiol-disulfide isomerase/thioredoxin
MTSSLLGFFKTNHQAWWLAVLLVCFTSAHAQSLDLDGTEVTLQITSPKSEPVARILWLPSEYGVLPAERKLAQSLAKQGLESWQVDVFEALFLSPTPSAVDEIPQELIQNLIQQAHSDDLPLFIIAPNKAAQLAARGLQAYQQTEKNQLALILINPNLYIETPAPGQEPVYWPHTQTLNISTFVLQAELSPWRWQLAELYRQLETSGSSTFIQILPQMRDRFYFRPDALTNEQSYSQAFDQDLVQAMRLLTNFMALPRQSSNLAKQAQKPTQTSKRQDTLQIYTGAQNRPLKLQDLNDQNQSLSDYQGKVVLLNFWASWCPPCLHEMPSMTRLKSQMANRDFEILAVNLAEQAEDFQPFLQQNPVNFPVLLDPQGQAIKDWQIVAYPTTYLIDKKGQIRYALFGGTEWDQAHHLEIIESLLNE